MGLKDQCYKPYSDELPYISGLVHEIVKGMADPASFALETQYTIYKTSTQQIIGRFHLTLETTETPLCTEAISGPDSCSL